MMREQLREKLLASRFLANTAQASVGVGERRSAGKGTGIEFVEHRAYQPGDDTRHLDARLMARLREPFIRLYSIDRQLPITIIVDGSGSMGYGSPDKFACALDIAEVLGFIGLNGGDQVRVTLLAGGRPQWSPGYSGTGQTRALSGWLRQRNPSRKGRFEEGLDETIDAMPRRGLVFLIADWWDVDLDKRLGRLSGTGNEIVAIHVVAPEEAEPALLGNGGHVLTDMENGEEIEIVLDGETTERYRAAFANWCETLRQAFNRRQARYFKVGSDGKLDDFFLLTMRGAGVIS